MNLTKFIHYSTRILPAEIWSKLFCSNVLTKQCVKALTCDIKILLISYIITWPTCNKK